MENSKNISEPNASERQESTGSDQESLTPSEKGKLGEPKISEEIKGELAPKEEGKFGVEEEIIPKEVEKKPVITPLPEIEKIKQKPAEEAPPTVDEVSLIKKAISLGEEAERKANIQRYEEAERNRQKAKSIYNQAA